MMGPSFSRPCSLMPLPIPTPILLPGVVSSSVVRCTKVLADAEAQRIAQSAADMAGADNDDATTNEGGWSLVGIVEDSGVLVRMGECKRLILDGFRCCVCSSSSDEDDDEVGAVVSLRRRSSGAFSRRAWQVFSRARSSPISTHRTCPVWSVSYRRKKRPPF